MSGSIVWKPLDDEARDGRTVLLYARGWRRPIPCIWIKTARTEGWRYAWPSENHPQFNAPLPGNSPEVYADYPKGPET